MDTVLGIKVADPETSGKEKAPVPEWGFTDAEQRQAALGQGEELMVDGKVKLQLVSIPAGSFYDVNREKMVAVKKPFRMSACEVSNELYALFDPEHDSRLESGEFLQFSIRERGYWVNKPEQPVCRVSWEDARKFCKWLSEKTGRKFGLPDATQWEWACRAGAQTPMWYGSETDGFDKFANLADINLVTVEKLDWGLPVGAIPEVRPGDKSQNDGHRVSAPAGSYKPNPWGLYDMHGNVAEWVDSNYDLERKLIKGGSWYDRPIKASASFESGYFPWQGVYNVGFRVIEQD
jgi:formylglycine-generating enzyme required for sulfatase activity